ncbi:MAG: glutamate racemase [Pseudomonadota bacterium]
MSHSNTQLLIIDSGVGGLSILNEIRKSMPSISSHYIADNAFYPYGILSEEVIIERVLSLAHNALANDSFSALVLACNTASTVALPELRKALNIPVIGVVPAIKPAAIQSQSKVIGLLATPGTVKRQYTLDLISAFASDCKVIRVGSRPLVDMAENMLECKHHSSQDYIDILQPFWDAPYGDELDTIVLGCTHFPLVKKELQHACSSRGKKIQWVDSGAAIAKRIRSYLEQDENADLDVQTSGSHSLYFTQQKRITEDLAHSLRRLSVSDIQFSIKPPTLTPIS